MKLNITNGNRLPNKIKFVEPYCLTMDAETEMPDGTEIRYTYNMNRCTFR